MTELLILASEGAEGIPPDHIAAKLAVPIGIVIFCGSVYMLLWSNYGAKKGAAIYGTAMFGFTFMLGIFWWFGAPGTPVATGLQNFPGQAPDAYQGRWFAFEPGSERAEFFSVSNNLDDFQTIREWVGLPEDASLEGDEMASFLSGDVEGATSNMVSLFLPKDDEGTALLGGDRRTEYQDTAEQRLAATVDNPDDWTRASPFFTAQVENEPLITESNGTRLAGANIQVMANFTRTTPDGTISNESVVVDTAPVFAFKDPGALWFPSAVWTGVSLVLFLLSLFALDRLERREKRMHEEIEEPEDLAVPIAQ